jgi:hypothetical protein
MNVIDPVRKNILELCSETAYGSWEFWLSKGEKTEVECMHIVETISELVKEKKIYPMEYKSVADLSCKEAPLDIVRLEKELRRSMLSDVDPDNFYWFIATEEGKKEDQALRRE